MIQGHGDDVWRFDRPIRANFSSNVYGHVDLDGLKEHLSRQMEVIGRYPEPEPYSLEHVLAGRLGVDPAEVCVTNGATEAIYLIAHAFADRPSTILHPTFSEYADACRLYSPSAAHFTALVFVPAGRKNAVRPENHPPFHSLGCRTDNRGAERVVFRFASIFAASETKYQSAAEQSFVWLCNPNNPTGDVIPKEQLIKAIEEHPGTLFVIDQSYEYFTDEPMLSAAEAVRFPNVIQIHSMTKRYAVPGLRLGYITAATPLLNRIRSVRMPWSVSALAIEAGLYLCEHPDTAPIDKPALLAETQRLRSALNVLPGLTATPTRTHFFLCHLETGSAAELKQWLAERHGLLIRDASNFEGLDAGHFRIAAQTPEENDLLAEAIRQYLEGRAE